MRYGYRDPNRYGGGSTTDAADAEFVGRVKYVGSEPQFPSGFAPALQLVSMTVTDARRGEVSVDETLDVDVLVVAGNPHIGTGASGLPALDASMVQPGVLLLAYANRAGDRWQAFEISTDGPSSANTYAGRGSGYRR